jgi:polysaccharide export outer membrane protein
MTAEPVSAAAEPVSAAAEPVSAAAEPVSTAPQPVSTAPQPVAAQSAEAAQPPTSALAFDSEPPYTLNAGDKLRIVVFGQDGLSNTYGIDAAGAITMPLVGAVTARGLTTDQLARAVAARLRNGFIREPHVAIEVDTYRPFYILGEVVLPGQYPYVPHMTVENAVAIAGGFTPRAYRWDLRIDRPMGDAVVRKTVPPLTRVRPGDTIVVKERWF